MITKQYSDDINNPETHFRNNDVHIRNICYLNNKHTEIIITCKINTRYTIIVVYVIMSAIQDQ